MAKPSNPDFVYLDRNLRHVTGKMDLDGNYSSHDAVRLVSIKTQTTQDIKAEKLNTDGPPKRAYLLAASVDNPAITVYELDEVGTYKEDFI